MIVILLSFFNVKDEGFEGFDNAVCEIQVVPRVIWAGDSVNAQMSKLSINSVTHRFVEHS